MVKKYKNQEERNKKEG